MNTPLLPKGNELNCHQPDHVTRISMCVWCDHLGHDSIGIGDTRVMLVLYPLIVSHLRWNRTSAVVPVLKIGCRVEVSEDGMKSASPPSS